MTQPGDISIIRECHSLANRKLRLVALTSLGGIAQPRLERIREYAHCKCGLTELTTIYSVRSGEERLLYSVLRTRLSHAVKRRLKLSVTKVHA
jgi:hypothetical protein